MPYFNTTNVTGPQDLLHWANDLVRVGGYPNGEPFFGLLTLFAIYVIIFVALKDRDTEAAFAVSTYLTFIVSLLLSAIGILSSSFVLMMVVVTAVSTIFLVFRKQKSPLT